jgi:hypothetical protein
MNKLAKESRMTVVIKQKIERDVCEPTREVLRPYRGHRRLRFISKVEPIALFPCHFITKPFSVT